MSILFFTMLCKAKTSRTKHILSSSIMRRKNQCSGRSRVRRYRKYCQYLEHMLPFLWKSTSATCRSGRRLWSEGKWWRIWTMFKQVLRHPGHGSLRSLERKWLGFLKFLEFSECETEIEDVSEDYTSSISIMMKTKNQAGKRSQLRQRNICSNVRTLIWSSILPSDRRCMTLSCASEKDSLPQSKHMCQVPYSFSGFSTRVLKALHTVYSACILLFNVHMPMDASETKLGFSNLPKDTLVRTPD